MTTNLKSADVTKLASLVAGKELKRAESLAVAVKRLDKLLTERLGAWGAEVLKDTLMAENYACAKTTIREQLDPKLSPDPVATAATLEAAAAKQAGAPAAA